MESTEFRFGAFDKPLAEAASVLGMLRLVED